MMQGCTGADVLAQMYWCRCTGVYGSKCKVKIFPINTNMSRVDITQLQPQQLVELRKSTEQEINHFTQSLQALHTAQSKLQDCISTIGSLSESKAEDLLVPMTASLYLPGRIENREKFLVDIGTGYFVEKSADDAKKVYEKKLTKLGEDLKKLKDILVQKNDIVNQLNMALRAKIAENGSQS